MKKTLLVLAAMAAFPAALAAARGEPGHRFEEADVEITLVASVFEWEVAPGHVIEAWGYNGEYPGPTIRVKVGQKVRITLVNELPEDTTIHFHGLEVPNDEDGVPGITQPTVHPGEEWTYEFVAPKAGTTMYHTHAHTVTQLPKGLFGAFIVDPADGPLDDVDQEVTMLLHETQGYYTINGKAFPGTLEDVVAVETGDSLIIRLINAGNEHHPMHLHGHQFTVVELDSNRLATPFTVNTQDIAPGQTIAVRVEANNPGTWLFHCHIIPHVTTMGEYPGGMLWVLDYTDHTSYMEGDGAALLASAREALDDTPMHEMSMPAGDADPVLVARGREVAVNAGCLACHTESGANLVGPTWLGLYGQQRSLADGTLVLVDEDYLLESVLDPAAKLAAGYVPGMMPATYRAMLSDADLEALVTYLVSLGSPAEEA